VVPILRTIHRPLTLKNLSKVELLKMVLGHLDKMIVKVTMEMKWMTQKETWINLMRTETQTKWLSFQVSKK
jgi:hypothetical protein